MADFWIQDHGSICLLTPRSPAAAQGVEANIGEHQSWGDAVVVEHRYIADIVEGAQADGLTIET